MSNKNAKAVAAPTMEEMMEAYLKLKAENEALKAGRASSISLSDKGGINVLIPSGKASVNLHFYQWQWVKVSAMRDEIDTFVKKNSEKLISEATFRANKAK